MRLPWVKHGVLFVNLTRRPENTYNFPQDEKFIGACMIILGVMVSLLLLGVIIRFAFSPQTDKLVKRAAIIALGAIGLAIAVCMIMMITGPEAVMEEEVFAGLPLAEPVTAGISSNRVYILVLGSLMLALIGVWKPSTGSGQVSPTNGGKGTTSSTSMQTP
jgi:hypothetical protein